MNKTNNSSNSLKQTIGQLIVALVLIIFPVLMIIYNGNRAWNGIAWQKHSDDKPSIVNENSKIGTHIYQTNKPLKFGVYDPQNTFKGSGSFSFEQIFISWIEPDVSALRLKLDQIRQNERTPVITIEPWSGQNDGANLFSDIVKGKYDQNIDRIIKVLSDYRNKLYISWGHEMDQELTLRYPWSGKDPAQYILGYQYVQDRIRRGLKNEIKWIWSPVGKSGCEKYWPGDNRVDLIGIPIYSYPDWDKSYYGHIRSFKSWYDEKSSLLQKYHKPIIINELGVTGSTDYQTYWLQEAFESLKEITSIEIVLFFHAKDTEGSWGKNIATPDWRTNPQTVLGLVDWFTKKTIK